MEIIISWKMIAARFACSVKTIKRWHKRAPFPITKIGNQVLLVEQDILKWLEKYKTKDKNE